MNQTLQTKAQELLKQKALKKTGLRMHLLETFLVAKEPLTQASLLQRLEEKDPGVDRVTLYRNLNQFSISGLIHEVAKNQYIFCEHECTKHPHLLLFCEQCQRHEEVRDHQKIDQFMVGLKKLKFFNDESSIHLKGLCTKCQNS